MKICPVGVELFQADGQTDGWTEMMELKVVFAILQMCLKLEQT
jgi:hypothetical protein